MYILDIKTAETTHRISNVEGNETVSNHTVRNQLKRFKSSCLFLSMNHETRMIFVGDCNALKRKVMNNQSNSTQNYSAKLTKSEHPMNFNYKQLIKT